jgi:hypothetical protein
VIENNRPPAGEDGDLRAALAGLDPLTRDTLPRVLIHDQAECDAVSSQLLRYPDGHGDDWAYIIDILTLDRGAAECGANACGD